MKPGCLCACHEAGADFCDTCSDTCAPPQRPIPLTGPAPDALLYTHDEAATRLGLGGMITGRWLQLHAQRGEIPHVHIGAYRGHSEESLALLVKHFLVTPPPVASAPRSKTTRPGDRRVTRKSA